MSKRNFLPILPSYSTGRGRVRTSSLPGTPRRASPGYQGRSEASQSSETLHSIAAGNKKAETMAPPKTKEKLTNARNLAKAKLLSVLQDTTTGLGSNPNKRKCQMMASKLKEASEELENWEASLAEVDPEAAILDEEDDFTVQGLAAQNLTLRRAVTHLEDQIQDKLDALEDRDRALEDRDRALDKSKEDQARIVELYKPIESMNRKFKKTLSNCKQYEDEDPDKGLVQMFKSQTYQVVNPIYGELSTHLESLTRFDDASIQAAINKNKEEFLTMMEETGASMAASALKWGKWVKQADPEGAEAASSSPRHREESGGSNGGQQRTIAKMEKLKYPKFSGSCKEYAQFIKDYNLLVKNNVENPQERAITLKIQCLQGEAKKAVAAEDEEEKMLQELKIRWGKPNDLVEEIGKEIDGLPKVKVYDHNFIKFIDTLRSLCNNLEAIGEKHQ